MEFFFVKHCANGRVSCPRWKPGKSNHSKACLVKGRKKGLGASGSAPRPPPFLIFIITTILLESGLSMLFCHSIMAGPINNLILHCRGLLTKGGILHCENLAKFLDSSQVSGPRAPCLQRGTLDRYTLDSFA